MSDFLTDLTECTALCQVSNPGRNPGRIRRAGGLDAFILLLREICTGPCAHHGCIITSLGASDAPNSNGRPWIVVLYSNTHTHWVQQPDNPFINGIVFTTFDQAKRPQRRQ